MDDSRVQRQHGIAVRPARVVMMKAGKLENNDAIGKLERRPNTFVDTTCQATHYAEASKGVGPEHVQLAPAAAHSFSVQPLRGSQDVARPTR